MSVVDALAGAGAKAAGKRPYFLNEENETTLAILMAVVQELSVTRQRNDTLERLLEQHGVIQRDEIENFVPDKVAAAERGLATQELIARVLRIVQQRGEAARNTNEKASEDVAGEISQEV